MGAGAIKTYVGIKDIFESGKELVLKTAIEEFLCRDKEVEEFLKSKAFDFDKRNKSRTYLIIDDEYESIDAIVVYGFFTLTMKTLELSSTLPKSVIKRIDGFSKDVQATEAVLLGQLGKNQNYQNDISGQEILKFALDTVYEIHNLVGGRIVFLECDEKQKLIEFYEKGGFVFLQKSGEYVQMLRYL